MSFSYPVNVTGVFSLVQYANSVSEGWFVSLILLGLFVILFISFKGYSTERAFGASSFITMLLTILAGSIGLVSSAFMIGSILIGAIGLVVLYISNHKAYG